MASEQPRNNSRSAIGRVAVGVVVLALGAIGLQWYLAHRSLAWQVRAGLQQLRRAGDTAEVRAALDGWERRLGETWDGRRTPLIAYLLERGAFDDWRVRALLTRLTGADFGDRGDDWRRWWKNHQRHIAGEARSVPRRDRVTLVPRWKAPIGLTAWYSTVVPLDGAIFVASLGQTFDAERDPADGVVRVDGRTGAAQMHFTPPSRTGRGPRDVIGLAVGTDALFVACYNGYVYGVGRDGAQQWETHVGSPVVAPPLGVDINQDGVCDVVVATAAAKAVAISGRTGNTVWVADIVAMPGGADLLGTTLALGDLLGSREPDVLVATPVGDVTILAARDGDVLWNEILPAGSIGGGVFPRLADAEAPAAYVVDRRANAWSLKRSGDEVVAAPWAWPALRNDLTIVAAPRVVRIEDDATHLLMALTGRPDHVGSSVCSVIAGKVEWRQPITGRIWAAPAVADLNGDHVAEVLVASIDERSDGTAGGRLTVLSSRGHVVAALTFDAPLESSPVVADVDGDQQLEVLVADQAGVLHCYGSEHFGPVQWGVAGGDSRNTRNATTAYGFGQTPFGFQWDWEPE